MTKQDDAEKQRLDQIQRQKELSDLRDASTANIISEELKEQATPEQRDQLMKEIRAKYQRELEEELRKLEEEKGSDRS